MLVWAMFISLVIALCSGFVLVQDSWPWMGHWVDVLFGLSFAMFIGSLVAVITRRAMRMLSDPGKDAGEGGARR